MVMAFRLLKPCQTCLGRTPTLRVVVALLHIEFRRQLVVSMARCLAAAPVLRQEIVTILRGWHQTRSLAACRTSFLLLKHRSNMVEAAGRRQYNTRILPQHTQSANPLNAKTWKIVRLDNHASQAVFLPDLLLCEVD